MNEPRWISLRETLTIHRKSIQAHGGADGIRDQGLLEAALARPLNISAYTPDARLTALAAAYASGIVRNHPFVDGNKRTGFIVAILFLELNGLRLGADEEEATAMMWNLAAGQIEEEIFAAWLDGVTAPA